MISWGGCAQRERIHALTRVRACSGRACTGAICAPSRRAHLQHAASPSSTATRPRRRRPPQLESSCKGDTAAARRRRRRRRCPSPPTRRPATRVGAAGRTARPSKLRRRPTARRRRKAAAARPDVSRGARRPRCVSRAHQDYLNKRASRCSAPRARLGFTSRVAPTIRRRGVEPTIASPLAVTEAITHEYHAARDRSQTPVPQRPKIGYFGIVSTRLLGGGRSAAPYLVRHCIRSPGQNDLPAAAFSTAKLGDLIGISSAPSRRHPRHHRRDRRPATGVPCPPA